jgi:hypothetical protein
MCCQAGGIQKVKTTTVGSGHRFYMDATWIVLQRRDKGFAYSPACADDQSTVVVFKQGGYGSHVRSHQSAFKPF